MNALVKRVEAAESALRLEQARQNLKTRRHTRVVVGTPPARCGDRFDMSVHLPGAPEKLAFVSIPMGTMDELVHSLQQGDEIWAHMALDAVDYSSGQARSTLDRVHRLEEADACPDCGAIATVLAEKAKKFQSAMASFSL